MPSSPSLRGIALAEVFTWLQILDDRIGQLVENKILIGDGENRNEIISILKAYFHPQFERLWLGTYQESQKVRWDILCRCGLDEDLCPSQISKPWLAIVSRRCPTWSWVRQCFPTLFEECKLDYPFTMPQGRAWIPDWMEFAEPKQETGLGELDDPGSPERDWVPGPRMGQCQRQEAESHVTKSGDYVFAKPGEYAESHVTESSGLLFANREKYTEELPQRRPLLADIMENRSYPPPDWPSREADYFDSHAAYEPATRQAAKSFLRCLERTVTRSNTRDVVRGVHTVRQMLVFAHNAARKQRTECALVNTIIDMNMAWATEKIGYCHTRYDLQEYIRGRFAKIGVDESPGKPAASSPANGYRSAPSQTCAGMLSFLRTAISRWTGPANEAQTTCPSS